MVGQVEREDHVAVLYGMVVVQADVGSASRFSAVRAVLLQRLVHVEQELRRRTVQVPGRLPRFLRYTEHGQYFLFDFDLFLDRHDVLLDRLHAVVHVHAGRRFGGAGETVRPNAAAQRRGDRQQTSVAVHVETRNCCGVPGVANAVKSHTVYENRSRLAGGGARNNGRRTIIAGRTLLWKRRGLFADGEINIEP